MISFKNNKYIDPKNLSFKYPLLENGFNKIDINKGIKVLKSGFVTMGKHTTSFEKEFAKKMNVKFALMVNSGSSANLLATFAACNPLRKNRFEKEITQRCRVYISYLNILLSRH